MNLKVAFKIHPILAALLMASILVLLFTTFKGCKQSKIEVAEKDKAIKLADSAIKVIAENKSRSDSTESEFNIKNELLEGQNALLENKLASTGSQLDKVLAENKELIAKHKLAQYADTQTVVVQKEYTEECAACFTKLETTTNLTFKYKSDLNNLQSNWDKQNQLYQKRFKELEAEKLGFYNQISSLAKQQKETADKLKPHGRLYLSWGILWRGWPSAAGGGFMYQTKYNMIYGVKYYYGAKGPQIETTMNFPLSIKF